MDGAQWTNGMLLHRKRIFSMYLHTTVYWKEKAFTIHCYLIMSSKSRGVSELKQLHRIVFPAFQEEKLHLWNFPSRIEEPLTAPLKLNINTKLDLLQFAPLCSYPLNMDRYWFRDHFSVVLQSLFDKNHQSRTHILQFNRQSHRCIRQLQ